MNNILHQERKPHCKLFNDNFQNYKKSGIPKAPLVLADIPYDVRADAYGSNPMWYQGGDNSNGESKFANEKMLDFSDAEDQQTIFDLI